jgi:transcriptional regulator with XRE-family HTH domain
VGTVNGHRISDVFRRRIRQEREDRGWLQDDLAERLNDLGGWAGGWDRSKVAKIENGQRRVSLDEAFVFAAVLNVPPPLLLLPLGSEDRVEVTPKSKIHPHLALEWLAGDRALSTTRRYVIGMKEWEKNSMAIRSYRVLRDLEEDIHRASLAHARAEYTQDAQRVREALEDEAKALTALYKHRASMTDRNVRPPALSKEWIKKMRQLGLEV